MKCTNTRWQMVTLGFVSPIEVLKMSIQPQFLVSQTGSVNPPQRLFGAIRVATCAMALLLYAELSVNAVQVWA